MVALLVKVSSAGSLLYWSERVGRNNEIFWMPMFRSMWEGTPAMASHLLVDPSRHLTPISSFLRKSSLDELPQLCCVLKGEMSFVGPQPASCREWRERLDVTETVQFDDKRTDTDWLKVLVDVEFVIHLAARVHEIQETTTDALAEFRRVNVEETLNLARQAAAGVRRYVFISSIKLMANPRV